MKLAASLIVRNERERYLPAVLDHLLAFCDEIRIVDDGSDDGTEILVSPAWANSEKIISRRVEETAFYAHEGAARQALLEFTLEGGPTHVLAIDADEFVVDGDLVRRLVEDHPNAPAFSLCMTEVWKARPESFYVRCDGRWGPHRAPILWRVPEGLVSPRIPDEPAASGRIPTNVIAYRDIVHTDVEILHLGWANEADRQRRHARYADAGSFGHDPRHIASILFPDSRVATESRLWPDGLSDDVVEEIVKRANP